MPSDDIPPPLLSAQRAYDAAEVVLRDAVAAGVDGDELDGLRATARAAVVELHRARKGTEFEDYAGQRRLQDAARGGE